MCKLLNLEDINFKYYSNRINEDLFNLFSLSIKKGEIIGLAGLNGSGKSTLLKLIRGILLPQAGSISINENVISNNGKQNFVPKVGYITQNPLDTLYPTMTVYENYVVSISNMFDISFCYTKKLKECCNKLILKADMGLEKFTNTQIRFLSGGQQQALSVMFGINNSPNLLLLDEPTAALDVFSSKQILSLSVQEMSKSHGSIILVSHKLADLISYSTRIIILESGSIIADIPRNSKEFNEESILKRLDY